MKKGKNKTEKRDCMSVVLVPHSSSQVKVLRFSSFYGKLLTLALLLVTLLTSAVILLVHTTGENRRLRESIAELNNTNAQQKQLIAQEARKVEEYKSKEETFNQKIKDCMNKYREILEKYLGRKSTNSASRSGDANERGFSRDVGELRNIVTSLSDYYGVNSAESSEIAAAEKKLKLLLDSIPTAWPSSGRISDRYGYRHDPFTGRKTFHEGLDIAAAYGSGIKAAASGKVIKSGSISGYGRAVIIDHGHGLCTLYGHSSKLLVKVGQTVKKGETIAKVGSSGRSTGPHIHFEVLLNNSPVDPLKYLDSK